MRVIAVTGSERGGTPPQLAVARYLVAEVLVPAGAEVLHHGDCVGWDAEMHELAVELGLTTCSHPPDVNRRRAYCRADVTFPPRPFLARDDDIARAGDLLLAGVPTPHELRRDGSWTTVRYALKHGRPAWVIRPDGTLEVRLPE